MRPRSVKLDSTNDRKGILMLPLTSETVRDLRTYYAKLHRIPALSDEEQHRLLACLAEAQTQHFASPAVEQARIRLIEGHLALAASIAWQQCPVSKRYLMADLMQEAALVLTETATTYRYSERGDFTPYAIVSMRARVRRALGQDRLIRVDKTTRKQRRVQGQDLLHLYEQLDTLISLDQLADEEETESSLYDTLIAPTDPPQASRCDEKKRAQVDALLSRLAPRMQAVVRLRYGLGADGQVHSPAEIAQILGITSTSVSSLYQVAMRRLRTLAQSDLSFEQAVEQAPDILCDRRRTPCTPQERMTRLEQAYTQIQAEGQLCTISALARLAQVSYPTAKKFLHRHQGTEEVSHAC
jgi:RNA polymerase sigma factor (sigma-70 family)